MLLEEDAKRCLKETLTNLLLGLVGHRVGPIGQRCLRRRALLEQTLSVV
jgi:hypothetical protein